MARERPLAERYHDATRYTPQNVAAGPSLDFRQQPSPFKAWVQAQQTALPGGPATVPTPRAGPLDVERLGRLLHHTYGVTLVREFPDMAIHFRAAPSAGGLYPTELYVATRGIEGVADGLHDYLAREHALALCWEGDFLAELAACTFDHPAMREARAALILTGVHARSAWRYQARAYRRELLDAGHVVGNAIEVAPQDGLSVQPIADFADAGVNGMLLLDEREEAVLLVAPIREAGAGAEGREPLASPVRPEAPTPEGPTDGAWIAAVHAAGDLVEAEPPRSVPKAAPPGEVEEVVELPDRPLPGGAAVLEAIRRRRSTRQYRLGDVPLEAVGRILAHAYPRAGPRARARIAPDLLETWVVAASVRGLAPGVHRYDPAAHALERVRHGCPRRALHHVCLLQELGRDCALSVVHTVDLPWALERHGERAYRYAHLEAGLLGQRLDLAALRLGFGASGIGGFFDDDASALLGVPTSHAVAYITTIGVPA